MKPVDDCPISIAPMTDEVRRDLKEERDSEAYQKMLSIVSTEFEKSGDWYTNFQVEKEALRRLRNG